MTNLPKPDEKKLQELIDYVTKKIDKEGVKNKKDTTINKYMIQALGKEGITMEDVTDENSEFTMYYNAINEAVEKKYGLKKVECSSEPEEVPACIDLRNFRR